MGVVDQNNAHNSGGQASRGEGKASTKPDAASAVAVPDQTANPASQAKPKVYEDGWGPLSTEGWIAGFTAVLTVATIMLGLFTYFLWRETRQAVEDAAISNTKLFDLNAAQADLAGRQHGLAREVFYAEHRPRLVIKDVYFLPEGDLSFEIMNIGGSETEITDGWFALGYVTDPRRFKDPSVGQISRVKGMTFARGEFRAYKHELPAEFDLARKLGDRLAKPGESGGNLYFYGAFHYADGRGEELGSTYLTVFRRKWNPLSTQFERTGNPDHEYAD